MKNPIVQLLQAVTDVVKSHVKERAVTIGDIWHFIQDKLDVDAVVAAGNVSGGMMSSGNVIDVYISNDSTYALIAKDGKLYKAVVTVSASDEISIGEYQEVVMEFAPVTGRQLQVKRSADGKLRWFAMPACTAVLNRDGEIDSRKLFDGFVEYAERTGNYPELDFFHSREQVCLGKADWVGRDGVNYCASGLFYDTPIARAAAKSLEEDSDYWGLSISYLPTKEPEIIRSKDGIKIPVFNDGINFYISLLPEDAAASILTSISTVEEVNRMNDKMKAALRKLTGDDDALFNEFVEKIDSVNRSAEGMISREANPAPATEPPAPVTAEATDAELEEKVTAIVEKILAQSTPAPAPAVATPEPQAVERENKQLTALIEKVDALAGQVAELTKSREAQIAEILEDLPSKITRQRIVRPRAAILPHAKNRDVNLAEIAEETLSQMSPTS